MCLRFIRRGSSCLLYAVDFATIEKMQASGQWDDTGRILASAAKSLEAAGADFILLATNTMHKVARFIEEAVSIPLLDIRDVVAQKINEAGVARVGLLATAYTMEQSFYRERIAQFGIDVVIPNEQQRAEVHRVIYEELCAGKILGSSRDYYLEVIQSLMAKGCDGVVLGCTEIELLVRQSDCAAKLFPTSQLHVEAAVDKALA